jgi:hypothetical protein
LIESNRLQGILRILSRKYGKAGGIS